jgi:hypothetical protein
MLINSTPATFDLATSNLFVECWVYFNSLTSPQFQCIVANGPTGSGTNQECWAIRINVSNAVDFIINSSASRTATSTTILSTGQWYHIAASYDSGSSIGYIFVNGGTPNSINLVTPKTSTGASLTLGAYPSPASAAFSMNGYISDLRVVKGGIVPTTSFTPSSVPFGESLPPYVTGSGTNVLSIVTQYLSQRGNMSVNTPGQTGNVYSSGLKAFGGTVTTSGNTTIHTFPVGKSIFSVTNQTVMQLLVVAGGGGGGWSIGGGGGAGGLVYNSSITVPAGNYVITVGSGGAGSAAAHDIGFPGGNSIVSGQISINAIGGGGGTGQSAEFDTGFRYPAGSGGSGGGGSRWDSFAPPGYGLGTASQGNNGGPGLTSSPFAGGGGGGSGAVGGTVTAGSQTGGAGGVGTAITFGLTTTTYAGGGGGVGNSIGGPGGAGGGGTGGLPYGPGGNGTDGLGGGGGGSGVVGGPCGKGGNGVVIFAYPF